MALDHMPSSCAIDARFQPVLDGCTQRGWRYRICFGEDVVSSDELAAPALSVAARLLWQHLKYELPRVSSVQSYDVFWRYLSDRRLTFAPSDVLEHICGAVVPAAERMLLVNLDEINVLFSDHHSGASPAPVTPQCQYLQHVLRSLLQLQIDGVAFVMPVLTATKALRVREIIRLSGCAFREIPLPLFTAPYVEELVRDLLTRARQSAGDKVEASGSECPGSIAAASAALAELQLQETVEEALPPLLRHLLELMAGHPRFLEKLLFRLGRPDGAADEWLASTFVRHMAELQSPAPPASSVLESWLGAVSTDILNRYAAFKDYLCRSEFVSIAPQLLGYTLFEWSVSRQQEFSEQAYRCTVQQLEEDGVVFLTPKPFSVLGGSSSSSSSSNNQPDVELRLVMPFLWLHVLYVRHAAHYASSVVQLPLVKTLTCQLSPAQNEELTLSVLALKCFCFAKQGKAFVGSRELFGVVAGSDAQPDVQIRLPTLAATQWPVVKLRYQVTAADWPVWQTEPWLSETEWSKRRKAVSAARKAAEDGQAAPATSAPAAPGLDASASTAPSPPRSRFFLNGEKAPFWDSCVLTDPPIFVQDKQSLVSRERVTQGKLPSLGRWADVVSEMTKCRIGEVTPAPLFLFCTDAALTDLPQELPDGVAVVDHDAHAAFFGPVLASRKAMCLSELGAAAIASAVSH